MDHIIAKYREEKRIIWAQTNKIHMATKKNIENMGRSHYPIHKKGYQTVCNNYRDLALLNNR